MKQKAVLTDREITRKERIFSVNACVLFTVMVVSTVMTAFYSQHGNSPVTVMTMITLLCSIAILALILYGLENLELVSSAEMTSLYKAVEDIPAAKDELCRILQVRQRVTQAEYKRIKDILTMGRINDAEAQWVQTYTIACKDHGMPQHNKQA